MKKSPAEIIRTDYKVYEVGKDKIGIGQIEVIEMLTFEKLKDALLVALNKVLLEKD